MANKSGRDANSSSRRCLTLVRVTTPTAPRTVLPTKFAVAEKHMDRFSPGERIANIAAKGKAFLPDWRRWRTRARKDTLPQEFRCLARAARHGASHFEAHA